jgi:hypothetical protein
MNDKRRDKNTGAFILIGLGVILLAGQLGIGIGFNWWAIFIALPGLVMLRNVYGVYQEKGELESNDLIQGGLGIFLVLMAASFLFDIGLGFIGDLWPLGLIAIGAYMLFGRKQEA